MIGNCTADLSLLDNPLWHTLRGRHAAIAAGEGAARRFLPDHHLLAACRDDGDESRAALAALMLPGEVFGLVTPWQPGPVRGSCIARQVVIGQMLWHTPGPERACPAYETLGDGDAAEMLALATLTAPGPYVLHTHRLGRFIGVRKAGRLVAMAGERMKPDGFTEISAVCTHPDHRGQGHAAGLIYALIEEIRARGEGIFLHAYRDNPAIALYEELGFRFRRDMVFTVLERATR